MARQVTFVDEKRFLSIAIYTGQKEIITVMRTPLVHFMTHNGIG